MKRPPFLMPGIVNKTTTKSNCSLPVGLRLNRIRVDSRWDKERNMKLPAHYKRIVGAVGTAVFKDNLRPVHDND